MRYQKAKNTIFNLRKFSTSFLIGVLLILGVESFSQDNRLNFFSLTRTNGLSNNEVTSIAKDHYGFIWFGTVNGLNRYNGYDFKTFRYSSKDSTSLPGNHVADIIIDRSGELWVGIFTEGLARYNSKSDDFKRYSLMTDWENVSPNEIRRICVDSNNNLWVVTADGLYRYNRESDSFTKIYPISSTGKKVNLPLEVDSIVTLTQDIPIVSADENGGVWVIYPDMRLSYLHLESSFSKHYPSILGLDTSEVVIINKLLYHNGLLYIATLNHGLIQYNPNTNHSMLLLDRNILSTATDVIDYEDELWITSFNGLIKYDLNSGEFFHHINRPGDPKSLSSAALNTLFIDDNDMLWIGVGNSGVNYANIKLPFNQIYEDYADPSMLSQSKVNSLLHDSKGNLWLGYQSGTIEYLSAITGERMEVSVQTLGQDAGVGAIFKFHEDKRGDIYMGSWLGGLQKFDRANNRFRSVARNLDEQITMFYGVDVRDIEEDTDGNLWLIVHGKGLVRYDKITGGTELFEANPASPNQLSNSYIIDICLDDDNSIWVTTAWGTNRMSIRDGSMLRYFASDEGDGSIMSNSMQIIYKGSEGRMWLGGNDGLSLYNPIEDTFFNIRTEEYGFPQLMIKSITEDQYGNLWISSSNGIIRFDISYTQPYVPEIHNFFVYDVNHGILSEDFFLNSSSIDRNGNIFFGGVSGIDYFSPDDFTQLGTSAPIQIEEVRLFNRIIHPGTPKGPEVNQQGEAIFSHRENMLSFKFVSLNFLDLHRNNYYYKLEPLDNEWHNAGKERSITFANIAPGSYVFRVKTCFNIDDCEHEGAALPFVIKPPFWRTNYFRVISAFLFLALLTFAQMLWTANIRRKKIRLERLVKVRTKELEQKNRELIEQSIALNDANAALEERQQQVEQQSEELMVQTEALSNTNKELKKLNSVKDKLFSIIAHDLRNPFGTIIGLSELIQANYDQYDDAIRKKFIDNICISAEKAFMLLDNLLQWSRAQTNRIVVRKEELSLHEQVQATFEIIKGSFDSKGVLFSNNIDENIKVLSDSELLKIIIRNLITNALKFTPVRGDVRIEAFRQDNDFVRISVTDTGVGISPDIQDKLFRFETVSVGTGTEGESGSGLGLMLCNEFATKLGGKIWIEDSSPQGTTISFTIPLAY